MRRRIQKSEHDLRDGSWMDKERRNMQAYEYLCRIGEAKEYLTRTVFTPCLI
jgi:hypothetical protein